MNDERDLVLDANIMVRGVLGIPVRPLLGKFVNDVAFYSPDNCFEEARRNIQVVSSARGLDETRLLGIWMRFAK